MSAWSDFTASKHVPEHLDGLASRAAKLAIFQDDSHFTSPHNDVEDLVTPIDEHEQPSSPQTHQVPLQPEDREPSSATYRERPRAMGSLLSFMTPIAEMTETSIGTNRTERERDYFHMKTPSRLNHGSVMPILEDDDENVPFSSPFQDRMHEERHKVKPLSLTGPVHDLGDIDQPYVANVNADGPLITDLQVNPVDPLVRDFILAHPRTRLSHSPGFFDHRDQDSGRMPDIRRWAKSAGKKAPPGSTIPLPPVLDLPGTDEPYTVQRELGAGAFAPVYLVSSTTDSLALKVETQPPSAWEFHILALLHQRLAHDRAVESLVVPRSLHLYSDASYLLISYCPLGTLLDMLNTSRLPDGPGLDESLAMFYTVELLRTVEALHSSGVIHGDIKADNILLRCPLSSNSLDDEYSPLGASGWSDHGITLIDLGRGIDTRAFSPDTKFIADWTTTAADAVELREGRPWKWQIDYHGIAAVAHTLLFGKYMDVVPCSTREDGGALSAAGRRRYKPREGMKRYWADVWAAFFEGMLNPRDGFGTDDLRLLRQRMEGWLLEKEGRGEGLARKVARVEEAALRRARR